MLHLESESGICSQSSITALIGEEMAEIDEQVRVCMYADCCNIMLLTTPQKPDVPPTSTSASPATTTGTNSTGSTGSTMVNHSSSSHSSISNSTSTTSTSSTNSESNKKREFVTETT